MNSLPNKIKIIELYIRGTQVIVFAEDGYEYVLKTYNFNEGSNFLEVARIEPHEQKHE